MPLFGWRSSQEADIPEAFVGPAPDSATEPGSPLQDGPTMTTTTYTRPGPPPSFADQGAVREGIRESFELVGQLFNDRLAGDDDEAWIPEEKDHQRVSDKLARIANRRIPAVLGIAGDQDIADLLVVILGLGVWARRSMRQTLETRRARRDIVDLLTPNDLEPSQ